MEIFKHLSSELYPSPLAIEIVPFFQARGRVVAETIIVQRPIPTYAESTRDGFALAASADRGGNSFQLIDKVASAGNTEIIVLDKGQACPVMTGGLVPMNAERVIPQEFCRVESETLWIEHFLQTLPLFIKKIGGEYCLGEKLLDSGAVVQPEHIALFASTGNVSVPVYRKPQVGFFSTGSELVDVTDTLLPGKKVASNRYLLSELCAVFGAESFDLGSVSDTIQGLTDFFLQIRDSKYDVLISTGGMGPGRFDLVEECFCAAGGKVVVNVLPMRPGKSILIGWLGKTLFYGLPGTPSAIRPLFTELIARSLLSLQGFTDQFPMKRKAQLSEDIQDRASNVTLFKPGRMSYLETTTIVRPTTKTELPNCYIVVAPHQGLSVAGSIVTIHLFQSPFCS